MNTNKRASKSCNPQANRIDAVVFSFSFSLSLSLNICI